MLGDQRRESLAEDLSSGLADDVTDEENVHSTHDDCIGSCSKRAPPTVTSKLESTLATRVQAIAADRISGASLLTRRAIAILLDASRFGAATVDAVAGALCGAQPATPLWIAAPLAVWDGPEAVQQVSAQLDRAPRALARVFTDLLMIGQRGPFTGGSPIAITTTSASESVSHCLVALARSASVRVLCAEARPWLEGRRMAAGLAAAGIAVTLCTDAAVTEVVRTWPKLDAVVVGADAVSPHWFFNKCGTGQLVTALAAVGVPAYVVASRGKFVGSLFAAELSSSGGPSEEVWDAPARAVAVASPYFERISIESVAMFVSDAWGRWPRLGSRAM